MQIHRKNLEYYFWCSLEDITKHMGLKNKQSYMYYTVNTLIKNKGILRPDMADMNKQSNFCLHIGGGPNWTYKEKIICIYLNK